MRGLIAAAVPAIKLTMTVPDAISVIGECADSGALIGAGTVLGVAQCHACIAAGAQFIVSPVTDPGVLATAHADAVPTSAER